MRWPWQKEIEPESFVPKRFEPINVSTPGPAELDVFSPTWIYLKDLMEEKIAALRIANDSLKKTEIQTAHIRGKIAALKELVATPENQSRDSRLNNTRLNAGDGE